MITFSRVLSTAVVLSTLAGCGNSIGTVTIENQGRSSANIELSIGSNRYELRDLQPTAHQTIWFSVPSQDSSYDVSASFASGATAARTVGYLGIDMTPSDVIAVSETGIGFAAGYRDASEPSSSLTPTVPAPAGPSNN